MFNTAVFQSGSQYKQLEGHVNNSYLPSIDDISSNEEENLQGIRDKQSIANGLNDALDHLQLHDVIMNGDKSMAQHEKSKCSQGTVSQGLNKDSFNRRTGIAPSLNNQSRIKSVRPRRWFSEAKTPEEHLRMQKYLQPKSKKNKYEKPSISYEKERFFVNLSRRESLDNLSKERRKRGLKKSLSVDNYSVGPEEENQNMETEKLFKDDFGSCNRLRLFKRFTIQRFRKTHQVLENEEEVRSVKKSRRKLMKQATLNDVDDAFTNISDLMNSPRENSKRSNSLPSDKPNSHSDSEFDYSDYELPRRMAICPNLSVPEMHQLKTYLILTRLQQYCLL